MSVSIQKNDDNNNMNVLIHDLLSSNQINRKNNDNQHDDLMT